MEHAIQALRIVNSMRYNALNGVLFPNKTVRAGAGTSYTNLTQPTDTAADWAGIDYTKPDFLRPGGIPSGRFCLADRDAPQQEE